MTVNKTYKLRFNLFIGSIYLVYWFIKNKRYMTFDNIYKPTQN